MLLIRNSLLIGGVVVWALGCGKGPSGPVETIVLGGVLDQTGSIASPGWITASELAIKDLNTGLEQANSNLRFKLALGDTTNITSIALERAIDVVQKQGAKAIVTDTSGVSLAIQGLAYDADTANDLNVPISCIICTSPSLNNPAVVNTDQVAQDAARNKDGWSFRTIQDNGPGVKVLMKIVLARGANGDANNDGKFKLSFFITDDAGGTGFVKSITDEATAVHPTPAPLYETIKRPLGNADMYNWTEVVTQLTDDRNETTNTVDGLPDAIFENTTTSFVTALIKVYPQTPQAIPIYHTHAFRYQKIIANLGATVNGQEGASPVMFEDNESGKVFDTAFRASGGTPEGLGDSGAYDSFMLFGLAAISQSIALTHPATELTGAQIRDAMRKVNTTTGEVVRTGAAQVAKAYELLKAGKTINYEGASGPVDFDANGNVRHRIEHYKGIGGQLVGQEQYDCVKDADCPLIQK